MACTHTLTGLARADAVSAECRSTARQLSGDDHGALFNATLSGAYRGQVLQLCFEIEELTRKPVVGIYPCLWLRGVEHNGQFYDIAFTDLDEVDDYRVFVAGTAHNVTGLMDDDSGLPGWVEDAIDSYASEIRTTVIEASFERGSFTLPEVDARFMPLEAAA